jgi:hypothetical protein
MIDTLRERHRLPMMTPAAILTRIGGTHSNVAPASVFRFAGEFAEKFRPCGIMNAFCQTVIVNQLVHAQIFYRNRAEVVYNPPAFLMGEVTPSEADTLMHPRHGKASLATFKAALCRLAMFALHSCQRLLFFPEKARVFNLFTSGKDSKGCESYINAHLFGAIRQTFGVTLDRKAGIPLAGTILVDSERFDCTAYRAMVDHFDSPDLRQDNPLIMREGKPRLREGKAIISLLASKAGIAWRLTTPNAAKEGFKGKINTNGYVLQDLRVNVFERRSLLFQYRKRVDLVIQARRSAFLFPASTSFFKQVVIQPTTFIQNIAQLVRLLFGWIETVLKHFIHTHSLAQSRTYVKKGAAHSSRPMNGGGSSRAELIKNY